jgi:porin
MQGGSPSALAGDAQGVSNIDAIDSWKLFEAWLDYRPWAAFDVRAGLYDLNSELDVVEGAAVFLNASHGIGLDFSQSGWTGPSIYPQAGLGLRAELRTQASYLRAAIVDGDPGDADGTHVRIGAGDGALLVVEAGHQGARLKLAAGGWRYTAAFPDLIAVDTTSAPRPRRDDQGAYAIVEASPRAGTLVFARGGVADPDVNRFQYFVEYGVSSAPPWRGRGHDLLGAAVAMALTGVQYRAASGAGVGEVSLEATYRAALRGWLGAQLDLQYVHRPSARASIDDAVVVLVRVDLRDDATLR